MTENVKKVLLGYIALSDQEKEELKKSITEYDKGTTIEKSRQYSDLNEKRITSPVSSASCPCCGK